MLLEFACSNHKSIRSEVLFSTLAGKDDTYVDRTYEMAGIRVLKAAVIYGANGSGKSNFVDAIAFVRKLVIQPGPGIWQHPHKLDGFGRESTYRIQFVTKGIRYVFGFSVKNMLVSDEYLYYFPNNRETKIFERSGEQFRTGIKFRGRFSSYQDVLKPNRLLLSCAAHFSSVPELADAYIFFGSELLVFEPGDQDAWMRYSLYQMSQNPKMKAAVLAFLADLGTGIRDMQVSVDKNKLKPGASPPCLSDELQAIPLSDHVDAITAKVQYETFETDLLQDESTGIQKLLAILCPLIDSMVNGKVLICDDLESSLHESLVYGLLKLFVNTDTDQFAQLVFTTHETGILNLNLFRRDQIWFTELTGDERSTDLYSLAEIQNVRNDENFERGYLAGKYGAIPMLHLDFAHIVSQMGG